jgi:hypothetical protein
MEKLSTEAKKQASDKKIEELKKKYVVRNFKTTTESFKFMKKIAKTVSSIDNLDDMKDEDILALFDVFDEKVIKYVISTFVLVRGEKKNTPVDYEKEFIGEFETLMTLFMMAIQHLIGKANGEGKQQATLTQGITSQKRA